jgi:hypothetical protein
MLQGRRRRYRFANRAALGPRDEIAKEISMNVPRKGRWFIYISQPGLIQQGAVLSDAEREVLAGLAG